MAKIGAIHFAIAPYALAIASRAYVLEAGRVVMSGSEQELLANTDVRKAFLGL